MFAMEFLKDDYYIQIDTIVAKNLIDLEQQKVAEEEAKEEKQHAWAKKGLEKILTSNVFDWLKDGMNTNGDFTFKTDGSMLYSKTPDKSATWKVMDSETFWINLNHNFFTLKYDYQSREAVLIKPERDPPSKMLIQNKAIKEEEKELEQIDSRVKPMSEE